MNNASNIELIQAQEMSHYVLLSLCVAEVPKNKLIQIRIKITILTDYSDKNIHFKLHIYNLFHELAAVISNSELGEVLLRSLHGMFSAFKLLLFTVCS